MKSTAQKAGMGSIDHMGLIMLLKGKKIILGTLGRKRLSNAT